MIITKYTTLLVRDSASEREISRANDPETARSIFCDLFHADRLPVEGVWQLCLNAQNEVAGAFCVGQGATTSCYVDVPSIARNALLTGACGVILAHNHPSG